MQILGKGRTENHCWAMVWLNGEPVHCDVTWEKPGKDVMLYRYFNLTDEQIARDHSGFAGRSTRPCAACRDAGTFTMWLRWGLLPL